MIGILVTVESGVITSVVLSKDRELLKKSYDEAADELNVNDDDYGLYIFDEDEAEHGVVDHIEAVYAVAE
jgi:hypothetical protein